MSEKKTKQEYILEAAKLYGLGEVEITALRNHLDGSQPNDFIVRKTEFLFRLYEVYKSTEYNDKIDTDDNGIIQLNDYAFEVSKRRLADSKIGTAWILSSNLECFLVTNSPDYHSKIKAKFLNLADTNNFLLPQIAKQMGLDATVYYRAEYTDSSDSFYTFHLTKNFLRDEETLIQGDSIVKENSNKRRTTRVHFESLLEAADKYVKKHYKKHKLPAEDMKRVREEIRQGLIKQTIFNKMVFNENEANQKWGLVICPDKSLKIAPLFSYDYCAGVEMIDKSPHRVVDGRKEDIESFMLEYGKEPWFRNWITSSVLPLDLDKAMQDMERKTSIVLSDEEKEYYKYFINKMHAKIVSVHDLKYDKELVEESKKQKLGDRVKKIKKSMSKKMKGTRKFFSKVDSDEER